MALYHKVLKKVLRYRFKNRNFATLKHSYQIDEKYILFFIALSVTFTTVAKEESLAKTDSTTTTILTKKSCTVSV